MNIEYKYTVTSVDETARCMEVLYEAVGHQTMNIGVRLPFEGELLEDIIRAFAPVPLWIQMSLPVVAPAVGSTGVIVPIEVVAPVETVELVLPTEPSTTIPQTVL